MAVESVVNAAYFKDKIRDHVKRVEVVASGKFASIYKSNKKTDRNDSEMLAMFLSKNFLPKARLRKEENIQIESLIEIRRKLTSTRTKLINKTHSNMFRYGHRIGKNKLKANNFEKHVFSHEWSETMLFEFEVLYKTLEFLKIRIKEIEQEIFKRGKELKGYENLVSIKGIGEITAIILLVTIDNIDDFKNSKHFTSYFGVVPQIRQSSGLSPRRPITKAGSKIARAALIQSTWVVIRCNDNYKRMYTKLKKRSGSPMIAVVACSRRLLVDIYYTLKNDWVFDNFARCKYHVREENELKKCA